jgi:hypothetical protein
MSLAPEVNSPELADTTTTTIAGPFASPLPACRPRAHEDESHEHDALQAATHDECLAASKRNGVKPNQKSARVGPTPVRNANAERKALRDERHTEEER